jgi:hypothetical protein
MNEFQTGQHLNRRLNQCNLRNTMKKGNDLVLELSGDWQKV